MVTNYTERLEATGFQQSSALSDVKLFGPVDFFGPSNPSLLGEDVAYSEGTVTWGYAQATGLEAEITAGVTAELNLDFKLTTVSLNTFSQWQSDTASYFSEQQRDLLNEKWGGSGSLGGFFGGCFGFLYAGGDAYHYKDKQNEKYIASSSSQKGFAKSVYDLSQEEFRITGTVRMTGLSQLRVIARVYIQTVQFTFAGSKKLTVINLANPIAAEPNRSTGSIKTEDSTLSAAPAIGG